MDKTENVCVNSSTKIKKKTWMCMLRMQCIVFIAIVVKLDMSVKDANMDCDVVEVQQNVSNLAEDTVKKVGGYDVFFQLVKVK